MRSKCTVGLQSRTVRGRHFNPGRRPFRFDGRALARLFERGRPCRLGFRTAREFQTVNGIKARGGSIDGPGPVVANGMVFINSGYSRFGGMPGNVLLALAP